MKQYRPTQFSFRYLISLMVQYQSGITLVVLLNILWSILQISIPFITKALVDTGIQNQDMDIVWILLISQFLIFIGITIADIFRKWLLRHIGVRVNLQLILKFLSGIIKKPYSFFSLKEQGNTIQHFNDNLRIESFLTNHSSNFFNAIIKLLMFGILLFIFDAYIGWVFVAFNILLIIWVNLFISTREYVDENRFKLSAVVRSELIEIFSGIIDLKSYNQEINRINAWDQVQTKFSDIRLNMLRINQLIFGGIDSLSQMRDIAILFIAAKLTIESSMTLGTLIAIQYILGNLNQPIRKIIDFVPQYQDAKLSLKRINAALSFDQGSATDQLSVDIPKTAGITLENVGYAYSEKKYAVKDINMDIPFGKSIAILGESGSGKSTLMKMMLKLLPVGTGKIFIGPKKLSIIDSKSWLNNCSVVLQESILFQRSVLYNITFEEESANTDLERVYRCLELCEVLDVVEALAHGLRSIVGEEGINFSRGQAQRIILARAMYKNVDYYFLDEPFSALDRLTYKKVFKNLRDGLEKKTLIIVTHKMEVAKKMDMIYLLEEGELVEKGNHESLSKLGKKYSDIFLSED